MARTKLPTSWWIALLWNQTHRRSGTGQSHRLRSTPKQATVLISTTPVRPQRGGSATEALFKQSTENEKRGRSSGTQVRGGVQKSKDEPVTKPTRDIDLGKNSEFKEPAAGSAKG